MIAQIVWYARKELNKKKVEIFHQEFLWSYCQKIEDMDKIEDKIEWIDHTVRNLHFQLSFPEKIVDFLGGKTRENVVVLDLLAVDNFDFTRKIVKKKLCEKLVKIL